MRNQLVSIDEITRKIFVLRGRKVMMDADLAGLYGVKTRVLNQAVKRNLNRFPEDFMLQLTLEELESSRSQYVILKRGQNIKYTPYAFTEQGVAMLSSVLRSPRAIQVNIEIMRAFVRLRHILATHADLARKLEELEKRCHTHDLQFEEVFEAIREIMNISESRRRAGFRQT